MRLLGQSSKSKYYDEDDDTRSYVRVYLFYVVFTLFI